MESNTVKIAITLFFLILLSSCTPNKVQVLSMFHVESFINEFLNHIVCGMVEALTLKSLFKKSHSHSNKFFNNEAKGIPR